MNRPVLALTLCSLAALTALAVPAGAQAPDETSAIEAPAVPEAASEVTGEMARPAAVRQPEPVAAAEPVRVERARRHGPKEAPMVATVVPLGFFFTVVVVLALALSFRLRIERLRHQTIQQALDKGIELPRELLMPSAPRSDLRRGLVLIGGGAGLGLGLAFLVPDEAAWAVGLFPVMIGMGYLASWGIERWERHGETAEY